MVLDSLNLHRHFSVHSNKFSFDTSSPFSHSNFSPERIGCYPLTTCSTGGHKNITLRIRSSRKIVEEKNRGKRGGRRVLENARDAPYALAAEGRQRRSIAQPHARHQISRGSHSFIIRTLERNSFSRFNCAGL